MQTTEQESDEKKPKQEELSADKTRSLASTMRSEVGTPAVQLSKDLANSLMGLIKDVNKDGVTPETVNASCNAAAQIYKILRLNYDMKREGF